MEEVNAAERSIKLSGVDLVDGTPVFDIKPYVPDYDRPRARDGLVSGGTGDGDDGVRVAVSPRRGRQSHRRPRTGEACRGAFLGQNVLYLHHFLDWRRTRC